ncbi:hypothetical protein V6x_13150 [Gimesia chilikensis]|uniref:Uncharacterized protein n=1 Tax=Gimesia chilikensis TaxID=2605989 RepID=A0A517W8Q8_9PLAN|nr:hypothetical protein V6x_13150 [Gimesia chilikensis]
MTCNPGIGSLKNHRCVNDHIFGISSCGHVDGIRRIGTELSSIHRFLNRGKGIRPENQPYCLAGFTKCKSDSITRVQTRGPLVIRELQVVIHKKSCQQRPVFQDFSRGDLVVDSRVPATSNCTAVTRAEGGAFFDA